MRRRVMLWGLTGDPPFDAVRRELERVRAPLVVLDQRDPSTHSSDLAHVRSCFVRPYDSADLIDDLDPAMRAAASAHQVELCARLDDFDGLVVNRPSASAPNASKPFQAELIRRADFDVPATLVTTAPDDVRSFVAAHGTVIYKSVSGMRSAVTRLAAADDARIDDVMNVPTQFQEYVPGTDWRVHVVNDEPFACEIRCDADDYRLAPLENQPISLRAALLPDDVAERCVALARALNLVVAGIDLRRRDDGRWYCFEANPAPVFTYYEAETGQPLTAAVAALLLRGAADSTDVAA
jgi:glutathione synthase/RimK-type ligase-like ATP-grasp enzyme